MTWWRPGGRDPPWPLSIQKHRFSTEGRLRIRSRQGWDMTELTPSSPHSPSTAALMERSSRSMPTALGLSHGSPPDLVRVDRLGLVNVPVRLSAQPQPPARRPHRVVPSALVLPGTFTIAASSGASPSRQSLQRNEPARASGASSGVPQARQSSTCPFGRVGMSLPPTIRPLSR
jgi:hypothetical protein